MFRLKECIKALCIIMVMVLLLGVTSQAYTTKWKYINGGTGTYVSYLNKKSDVFVIGASNVAQMYNAKCNGSFVACWGGHYGYGTHEGKCYRIDSEIRIAASTKIINKIKKKHGKCRVFVYATTNDWKSGGGYKGAIKNMVDCAKSLKGDNITVYCCSMIGMKGTYVGAYNRYLKKQCKKNGIKYKNVRPKEGVKYLSDDDHYKIKSVKAIFNKIKG